MIGSSEASVDDAAAASVFAATAAEAASIDDSRLATAGVSAVCSTLGTAAATVGGFSKTPRGVCFSCCPPSCCGLETRSFVVGIVTAGVDVFTYDWRAKVTVARPRSPIAPAVLPFCGRTTDPAVEVGGCSAHASARATAVTFFCLLRWRGVNDGWGEGTRPFHFTLEGLATNRVQRPEQRTHQDTRSKTPTARTIVRPRRRPPQPPQGSKN